MIEKNKKEHRRFINEKTRTLHLFCSFILEMAFCDQGQIVSDFEKKVDLYNKFFSTEPTVLLKETYSKSPTGLIFFYDKVKINKITYDVKNSDSLVSPYIGYIHVDYTGIRSNCGDIESALLKVFSNLNDAISNKNKDLCFAITSKPIAKGSKVHTDNVVNWKVTYTFAYQKNQWKFKDVKYSNGKDEWLFNTAMCTGKTWRPCLEQNALWKSLIE